MGRNRYLRRTMRELTIQVPDELFGPVKKLLQNLRGARVTHTRKLAEAGPLAAAQLAFVADLQESLRTVERHQRGEISLPTLRDFLAEDGDV